MVPVYATTSLLALASPPAAPFASAARECYEAFTIHSFVCFVLAWLEADAAMSFCTYAELLAAQPAVPHPWPLRACLRPWPMGAPFVARVRWGVVNYVAVRLLTAALSVALALAGSPGLFAEGDFSPRRAYVYAAALNSASQAWALYCLVMLYHAARNDLAGGGVRVLPKFCAPARFSGGAGTGVPVPDIVRWSLAAPRFVQCASRASCLQRSGRHGNALAATGGGTGPQSHLLYRVKPHTQGLAIAVAFHLGAARLVPRGSPGDTAAQTATRLQSFLVCVESASGSRAGPVP